MEDIKIIIWALEHYDFKLDCVPEKVVNMINELLNGYKKLQQENQQYKNAWEELKEYITKENITIQGVEVLEQEDLIDKMEELEQKHNIERTGGKE